MNRKLTVSFQASERLQLRSTLKRVHFSQQRH